MKVTIKYVCPECDTCGVVTFTELDERKDFRCLECGFPNSLEIKSCDEDKP